MLTYIQAYNADPTAGDTLSGTEIIGYTDASGLDKGMTLAQLKAYTGGGAPVYASDYVNYEAASLQYLLRNGGLTGSADGRQVTGAFGIRIDAVGIVQRFYGQNNARFAAETSLLNSLRLQGRNAANTTILDVSVAASDVLDAGLHTVAFCIDMDNQAACFIYIDDVQYTGAGLNFATFTADDINLAAADFSLMSATTGGSYVDGCLSNFMLHGIYIDLSNETLRRNIITAANEMADPGTDGSNYLNNTATPFIMLQGDNTAPNVNSGAGEDFVVQNGPLTACV